MVRNSEIRVNNSYLDIKTGKQLTVLGFRYHDTEKWAYVSDQEGTREEVELYRLKSVL